jgi:hypothetical protein
VFAPISKTIGSMGMTRLAVGLFDLRHFFVSRRESIPLAA